ncbi:MAG TPA: FMN-binding protein [Acidothermaceae bacterium]|nr:FMN-binding protein [Acidothermaceae bacterium]
MSEGRRVFGVVQVRLTLTNGKITAATAIQFPQNDGHSLDLSNYSIPKLSREVLSAQSASIDAVSSATYTSEAYAQSVQAALDAAKA